MKINKDTAKFFSVASRPGNFGATIYNELFRLLGINAIYVPLGVDARHGFAQAFRGLELIGARGINVSMPFKWDAKDHVYNCPHGPVNTLRMGEDGIWEGYNTDAVGFRKALQEMVPIDELSSVYIFGAGAVASTVMYELESTSCKVTMGKHLPAEPVDLFVNASPVGMDGIEVKVPWEKFVCKARYVFDAVISQPRLPTQLVRAARDLRKPCVEGQTMCKHGLVRQFTLHVPHQDPAKVEHLVTAEMKEMGYAV